MRKFPSFVLLSALLTLCACSDDEEGKTTSGDLATVTFTLETESSAETRAYSDGLTATYLMFGVYDSTDTTLVEALSQTTAVSAFSSKKATVELSLPKGGSYIIVFWAQASGAPFTVDLESDKTVTLKGTTSEDADTLTMDGNNESMDAFYALVETGTVTGDYSASVTMKRPFAQLNIGSNDLTAYKAAEKELNYVKVQVTGAANTFDLLTGEVSFDGSTNGGVVVYDWAELPDEDESFPVDKEEETDDEDNVISVTTKDDAYTYLSMNYLLVAASASTIDVEFWYSASEEEESGHSVSVASVPVQRNYRTNLYGSLLTGTFTYDLEIDEEYEGDNNISVANVSSADELVEALADGVGEVILTNDITVASVTMVVYDDATIDLGGNTLTISDKYSRIQVEEDDVEVTITNGTIESNYWAVVVNAEDASVTLDDVDVTSTSYAVYLTSNASGSEVTITDSEIESASYAVYVYSGTEGATITVENSTISSTSSYAVRLAADGVTFEATGSTITSSKSSEGRDIYSTAADANISLDDVTLESTYLGIYATGDGTTITATDVIVTATTHSAYYVYADSATVTVTGGTVSDQAVYGVATYGDNSNVTVSGTTFEDCGYDAIAVMGSNNTLDVDSCTITASNSTSAAYGILVGQSSGTTTGNDVSITNTTIDVSETQSSTTSGGVGLVVYGYSNDITIENCTITHSYMGITQQGTSTPGSEFTLSNTTITGPYQGIYLSMSTSSTYYNTLTVQENCSITSTKASAIEVKKTYLTVKNSSLVSQYEEQQDYSLYGAGAAGSGYGIVLAGYTAGRAYFYDFNDTTGVINLSDITYTLAANTDKNGSTPPWYVLYYQGYTTEGNTSTESSCNYTSIGGTSSDGANSSSSYGASTTTSSSARHSAPPTRIVQPKQRMQRPLQL